MNKAKDPGARIRLAGAVRDGVGSPTCSLGRIGKELCLIVYRGAADNEVWAIAELAEAFSIVAHDPRSRAPALERQDEVASIKAEALVELGDAMKIFAPDLAEELVKRWHARFKPLEDLLKVLGPHKPGDDESGR